VRSTPIATIALVLAVALASGGCGDDRAPPPEDGGPGDAGGYDPELGNLFEGRPLLDDDRVMAMEPAELPAGDRPCRAPVLVRVTRVVDGDTVIVAGISEPLNEHVRLIGVDTPEVAHDGMPADCYGEESAAFTEQLVGHVVWLTFDATCRDRFDRLLAYLHVGPGSRDLWERQQLRRGLATVLLIGDNRALEEVLRQDEYTADREERGLWAACR